MIHRLSGFGAVIAYQSEIFRHAQLFRYFSRRVLESAQQRDVFLSRFRKTDYVLFRYEHNMCGGLGVHVIEGRQFVCFMHKSGFDLMSGYSAEEAVFRCH